MARRGSLRSPVVTGGGVAFGPHPHDYQNKMPRSLRRRALASALSLKGRNGQVRVIEDIALTQPSTKTCAQTIEALGLGGGKVLVVTAESAPLVYKSCRNIPGVQVRQAAVLCTYDVMWADVVLFTRPAVAALARLHAGEGAQG
jgi:large subunit ribosomal protein L4